MMWNFSHAARTPSIPMPMPSPGSELSVPHHPQHHRSSSAGAPTGWSGNVSGGSRATSPRPMAMPAPASFINSPPVEYAYEPSPRALLTVPVHEHYHHRSSHRRHSHSRSHSRSHSHSHSHSPKRHSHHSQSHSRPHTPAPPPAQIIIAAPPPQHQVLRKPHKQQHQQQQPVYHVVSKPHTHAPAAAPVPVPSVPLMPPIHPNFMYSRCTGRRKALCIGVNYFGKPHELRGCINDAKNVFHFLVRHASYRPEDIVVLTDDARHHRSLPTRRNMIDAMHWLIKDAKPHDALFFHYSGHGGQTKDLDGDEVDGYDEVIFPMDFQQAGQIVDDEMHDIMVRGLPAGCRLTAVFDVGPVS
ncbi:unnamed protein product [Mycena citricolor]|uniref:Peptidase C14 caspase domain-containing protein n=1 Tax=Mycena citricolor TaxID=2018698 RepID=A0AAD2Q1S6_9AGAR|nr:unnamed protein product [Mycena citricolor]